MGTNQLQTGQDVCKIFKFEDEVEVQHHNLHYKQLMEFDLRSIITTPNASIWMEVGSVNGLLCLHDISSCFNAFYICNPVTHEYIALPRTEEAVQHSGMAMYGFGVSSSSGEYKLVRICRGCVTSSRKSSRKIPDLKCLIYTLGTGSWRSITLGTTFELNSTPGHAFLSGSLHWLEMPRVPHSLLASILKQNCLTLLQRIGNLVVLGDCLCVCDWYPEYEIVIWVMKDYGVGESWTKEYVINRIDRELNITDCAWPLKAFKDGDTLFFREDYCLFYCSSKDETIREVDLFEGSETGEILPMLHTPSFVSLKRFEKENVASFGF